MGGRPDAESNQGPHVGWLRAGPGRPWEELVRGPDFQSCMRALLAHRGRKRSADLLVLPEGRHPGR